MGTVERFEVNGVRGYFAQVEGPHRAALYFRVGAADETVFSSGITHTVEHLALFAVGQRDFAFNGTVDARTTALLASGRSGEISRFLFDVCANLRSLPLGRLEAELRVLRNEASIRGVGPWGAQMRARFGFRGPGLESLSLGLNRLTKRDVERWAARYFCRENAVLVVVGPDLPTLELPLPSGDPPERVVLEELIDSRVWAEGPDDHVGVSVYGERSFGLTASVATMQRRLERRARYDLGVAYVVQSDYRPLTATRAAAMAFATAGGRHSGVVVQEVAKIVDDLSGYGPTEEELTFFRGLQDRMSADDRRAAEAFRLAIAQLLGGHEAAEGDLDAELRSLTPSQCARDFGKAAERAIALVPSGAGPVPGFGAYPSFGLRRRLDTAFIRPGSKVFDSIREPRFALRRRHPYVVLNRDAVAIVDSDDAGYVYRYEDIECLVTAWEGPVSIIDARGTSFYIDPTHFKNGSELCGLLLDRVPPERVIELADTRPASVEPRWPMGALPA